MACLVSQALGEFFCHLLRDHDSQRQSQWQELAEAKIRWRETGKWPLGSGSQPGMALAAARLLPQTPVASARTLPFPPRLLNVSHRHGTASKILNCFILYTRSIFSEL